MAVKWWRAAFVSELNGQAIVHTMGVKADKLDVNQFTPAEVALGMQDWLVDEIRASLPTGGSVQNVKVVEFIKSHTAIPASGEKQLNFQGTGDFGGEELPREMVAHVKLSTDAAIRSGHGGFFSGPIWKRANLSDDGLSLKPGTAFMNALQALGTKILAGHDVTELALPAGHLSAVVLSRTRIDRGDADWAFDVTGFSIRQTPTWLRSRAK